LSAAHIEADDVTCSKITDKLLEKNTFCKTMDPTVFNMFSQDQETFEDFCFKC
jgi:hypothetical protein